jgi:hypothetical protein
MAFSGASDPAYTISRLGQDNFTGDVRGLFLQLFAGEVLTAYQKALIFEPLVRKRTINHGRSASFPMIGRTTAEYLTPGNEITGGKIRQGQRIIELDDLLISSVFIPEIDEAINHFDVRATYSKECGLALARETEKNIARMLIKAALAVSTTEAEHLIQRYSDFAEEDFTSNVYIGDVAGDETDPSAIAYSILMALKEWASKGIDPAGAVVILPPEQYYALLDVRDASKLTYMNTLYGGTGGINGVAAPLIHGLKVMNSQYLDVTALWNTTTGVTTDNAPLANTAGSGRTTQYDIPNAHGLIASSQAVRGLVFTKDAVAGVNLMSVSVESERQMTRQGTLIVAKKAEGYNVLRPASAIALLAH